MPVSRAPERVEFAGSQGAPLAGRLELPEDEPLAYALFAHCFTCGKDAVAATRISRALTERGIAVLRFDFTGLGQSGGDFASSNFTSNVEDLVRAAAFLGATRHAPSILIGHSLGGAAVLAAVDRIPEVRAVVTIGAPADPRHVLGLISDQLADLQGSEETEVTLGGRRADRAHHCGLRRLVRRAARCAAGDRRQVPSAPHAARGCAGRYPDFGRLHC